MDYKEQRALHDQEQSIKAEIEHLRMINTHLRTYLTTLQDRVQDLEGELRALQETVQIRLGQPVVRPF